MDSTDRLAYHKHISDKYLGSAHDKETQKGLNAQ